MNLMQLPVPLPSGEMLETLTSTQEVRIERIISTGQSSPEGFWYDQELDEWVALLQGEATLAWQDGRTMDLFPGDWLLIPANEKHRVERTSSEPPCIWLAVYFRAAG